MKSVAVFFGGKSVEHDISVITGVMTVNSLDRTKYNGVPIYVDKNGEWFSGEELFDLDNYKNLNQKKLKRVTFFGGDNKLYCVRGKRVKPLCEIAVAINCMHGERGEDGSLSGLLAMCGVPLASPPTMASAVCMDKSFTKTAMKGLGVNTLKSITVFDILELSRYENKFVYPLIVKPNKSGSSIGVTKADNFEQLKNGVLYALRLGVSAIIEPCLTDFIEINCACYLGADGSLCVSQCERPVGRSEILSFNDKYESGKRVFPADIDSKLADKIRKLTEKIYMGLSLSGVIRIDYFIANGKILVNEINTVPGSLAYYLFGNNLKTLTEMLNNLIEKAQADFAKTQTIQTDYKSGVLNGLGAKGVKKNAHKKD